MNKSNPYSGDFLKETFEKKSFGDKWEKYFPFKRLWKYLISFLVLLYLFIFFVPKNLYFGKEDGIEYVASEYWRGLETMFNMDPVMFWIFIFIISINLIILIIGFIISPFVSDHTV